MAGETHQEETDQVGDSGARPARPRARANRRERAAIQIHLDPDCSLPAPLRSGAASGSRPASAPSHPDILPRIVRTDVAYRQLVSSGLTSNQAAALIGYVSGLGPNQASWTITQINRLLFLRSLYHEAEWGEAERQPAP